jgi:hypothetical protein
MSRHVVWHGQSQARDLQVAVARYSACRFNDMVGMWSRSLRETAIRALHRGLPTHSNLAAHAEFAAVHSTNGY